MAKPFSFFVGSNAQLSAEHFPCHLASHSHCFWWVITSEIFSPFHRFIAHREFIRFSLTGWVSWQNAISSFMSRPVRALRNFSRAVNFESSQSCHVYRPMWEKQHQQHIVRKLYLSSERQTREKLSKAAYKFKVASCFILLLVFPHSWDFLYIYIFLFEKMWENRAELANENSINVK